MSRRRAKKAPGRGKSLRVKEKPFLSKKEMLRRVPRGELLTTDDIQHIFNDCHKQTVYKMAMRRELRPYRLRNRGRSNVYRREDVLQAIENRFALTPHEATDSERTHGNRNSKGKKKGRGKRKPAKARSSATTKASRATKASKARRKTRRPSKRARR